MRTAGGVLMGGISTRGQDYNEFIISQNCHSSQVADRCSTCGAPLTLLRAQRRAPFDGIASMSPEKWVICPWKTNRLPTIIALYVEPEIPLPNDRGWRILYYVSDGSRVVGFGPRYRVGWSVPTGVCRRDGRTVQLAVSYTHLTLPTNYSV